MSKSSFFFTGYIVGLTAGWIDLEPWAHSWGADDSGAFLVDLAFTLTVYVAVLVLVFYLDARKKRINA